ncbi:MAG: hypothetical protein HRU38_04590 [Saccharospirillaceae bacterium]|nr:hypothetical protein [Pseudomonadales bacterium]NRB77936.1 hypothetical protein [Saccharospirillaceae bacterium]
MSTNADSAKKWVEQNKPDTPTLLNFIQKLEDRLEKMNPEDPSWDGNEEAMFYLSELVEKNEPAINVETANLSTQPSENQSIDTSSLHNNESYTPNWDVSSLTPAIESQPELSAEEKRVLFEQLKIQVKQIR